MTGMTFQRWRKKPFVVEAVQWDGTAEGATPIINWILENDGTANYYGPGEWDNGESGASYIRIHALKGLMQSHRGHPDRLVGQSDWVIRGIKGEFYPCKPDIFERIYEPEANCAERDQ